MKHKKADPETGGLLEYASGGDEGARTLDPRLAKPVLSQLSYVPRCGTHYNMRLRVRHPPGAERRSTAIHQLAATRAVLAFRNL